MEEKYYLIFKNNQGHIVFIDRPRLNDIYELIIDLKLKQSTYRIIKGEKII